MSKVDKCSRDIAVINLMHFDLIDMMIKNKLRIVHICLASSYTEGMLYQDNILPSINKEDGHEVLVVSDCTCYVQGKISKTYEDDKILDNGVRLVRLGFYGDFLPSEIKNRLRYAPKLETVLDQFKPDVILYHSLVGLGLLTVGRYKKKHPQTRLYLDTHADFNNSATSKFSRWLQYSVFNRLLWRFISKSVDKVFYISEEAGEFIRELYKINDDQLEFFPLGGFVQDSSCRELIRHRVREKYLLSDDDVVFIHTGKFNAAKCTLDILRVFLSLPHSNIRLVLAGVIESDIHDQAKSLLQMDHRVTWLGWKSGEELIELMCASDVYLQPGSQSASLQTAICCGLPILIYPHKSHFPYLKENGFFVDDLSSIRRGIEMFVLNEKLIKEMSANSIAIAEKILDYKKIAARIYR